MLAARNARGTNDETAQAVALTALAYLLSDDDRAARFLATTGLGAVELFCHVKDPAFLGGVLDVVLADEALLLGAAEAAGVAPDQVARLRRRLPGAPLDH